MRTTAHTQLTTNVHHGSAILEIEIEELEGIIAPAGGTGVEPLLKLATNHNETFVYDEETALDV